MFPKPWSSRLFRTSSFRLTLFYTGVFTLSVLILFGLIYWSAANYIFEDESEDINSEFVAIQDEARIAGESRLPDIVADHVRQHAHERAVYLLEDTNGAKISGNVAAQPPLEGAATVAIGHRRVPAFGYRLANGDFLLIGQDPQAFREMKELIARVFGIGLGASLVLAVLGGIVVSRRTLKRVEQMSRTSRAIVAGDLAQRVPLRGVDDEFDHLAASVNGMLDRIEDLMKSMRQVSNDIAHDLRTPLTRLRHRLEKALRHEGPAETLRTSMEDAITQVDSILATFSALLRIAQIEAAAQAFTSTIDVSGLLTRIAEDFSPAAEDRGQELVVDVREGLWLAADRELLTQMIVNLVDNALRHSPTAARITIAAKPLADAIEVTVADNGRGIPDDERENVLRPFYRLDASRTTEGSGLGLSLVAAIVKRHGATLRLLDNAPGVRASVLFPTSP